MLKKLGKRGFKMELAMNSKFIEMNEQEMMEVDGGGWDEVLNATSGTILIAASPALAFLHPAVGVGAAYTGVVLWGEVLD